MKIDKRIGNMHSCHTSRLPKKNTPRHIEPGSAKQRKKREKNSPEGGSRGLVTINYDEGEENSKTVRLHFQWDGQTFKHAGNNDI